jgi:hypothetical protein
VLPGASENEREKDKAAGQRGRASRKKTMRDPLTQTSGTAADMYEYGEYDGLVDLDSILHGAANPTNPPAAVSPTPGLSPNSGATGVSVTSTTPNLSCFTGSEGNTEYANFVATHNHNANSGEQGPTPSPQGRSPARKPNVNGPASTSDRYPGMHGSNNSISRSNGGNPMTMEDSDVTLSTASAGASNNAAVAAPGSRTSQHLRGESAKGNRSGSNGHRSNATNTNNGTTDSAVHLPVIMPSQQRRPADTLMQPRVRVSPLTQDTNAGSGGVAAAVSASTTGTPHNARSATSVSPLGQNARLGGAKTVMSANNLAALQRNSNKVPPYLAPPLSPLHTRTNQPQTSISPAVTGGITGPSVGVAATMSRPVTDGSVKRGEAPDNASPVSPPSHLVDTTSPLTRSNGWVKEAVRRIDRTSQELATGFPQERLRQSSTHSNTVTTDSAGGNAETSGSAGRGKVNTSPAPAAPRAPVWSNDYEMGRTDLVGCTSAADFGVMPKVAAPPLPQRAKKTLSDSAGKRPGPFRPPPHIPSTPPVGATDSPVESVISPLRTVAKQHQQQQQQQRVPRQPDEKRPHSAADTPAAPPPPPQVGPAAAPPGGGKLSPAVASSQNNPADLVESRVHSGSSHPPPLSHRRVMNAVDTHISTPHSITSDRKSAAIVASANGTAFTVKQTDGSGAATRPTLPYSDDHRAALEAWAAFPALDVTIRGQSPTVTQLRRERDLAAARPLVVQQLYQPVKGQAPQEFAGEPFEMNYDVHNVVVQLRHRNRPLQMAYPPRLPLEPDMRPRLRRQRTPRSFYGKRFPHVGDVWFRNALDDARYINSPDIESMEKREEEEFVRNGGDPAQRRNRYGQANNHHNNNHQQQRQAPHAGTGAPNIEQINRNAVRMEQPAM